MTNSYFLKFQEHVHAAKVTVLEHAGKVALLAKLCLLARPACQQPRQAIMYRSNLPTYSFPESKGRQVVQSLIHAIAPIPWQASSACDPYLPTYLERNPGKQTGGGGGSSFARYSNPNSNTCMRNKLKRQQEQT